MLNVSGISLSPGEGEDALLSAVCKKARIKEGNITDFKIVKKSVDARKKKDIRLIYSVNISINCDEKSHIGKDVSKAVPYKYIPIQAKAQNIRPVVVGGGPGGLMAALILAQAGQKPILLERGEDALSRQKKITAFWDGSDLDENSNVQFGEGGAGTFSDGKLTTGIKDSRCGKVIEEFIKADAPEEIGYLAKPHIGTDNLIKMVQNLRKEIIALGGEVRFLSQLTDINLNNGVLKSVTVSDSKGIYEIEAEKLILAIGHSARDTFEMLLKRGVPMIPKAFSVGVRIEHPQEMINRVQYGDFAGHPALGAADYKLAVHLENGRGVYTFCMCPGGSVVASASEQGGICTNGMSRFARDGENANSAVLVGVNPSDFGDESPLAGMYFQRRIEQAAYNLSKSYLAPAQRVGDFLDGVSSAGKNFTVKPTYLPGVYKTDLSLCLPGFVTNSLKSGIALMDRRLCGFASRDAVLTAPETRSSSPVRIIRDEECQSEIKGIYPCGEGAGYAGGIMSAAVDGIRCAEEVLKSYNSGKN